MAGSLKITWKEFKEIIRREDRVVGLEMINGIGRYDPWVFKGENNKKITMLAGYRVIQEISKIVKPRITSEYRTWRKAVLARDEFMCTKCKSEEDLHVHHIEKICDYPTKMFEHDNGMTLCGPCHRKQHKG